MLDGCKLPGCPLLRLTLRSSDRNLLIIYSSGADVPRLFLFSFLFFLQLRRGYSLGATRVNREVS